MKRRSWRKSVLTAAVLTLFMILTFSQSAKADEDPALASTDPEEALETESGTEIPGEALYGAGSAEVYDSLSGSFRGTVSQVTVPGNTVSVRAGVWSQVNGQDDLTWIDAKGGNGQWYVDVDTAAHQYDEGIYFLHFYAFDSLGNGYFLDGLAQNVTVDRSGAVLTGSWDPAGGRIRLQLTGAYTGRAVTKVRFAVWSSVNGQDDLKWYNGSKGQNGSWDCSVPMSAHKGTGVYYVHAYYDTAAGSNYAYGTGVETGQTRASVSSVTTDGASGAFRVYITNVTVPETVKDMRVAVWSRAGGQDDLVWVNAVRNGSSWYLDVNPAAHLYDEGIYDIHLYVLDNGNNGYMCAATSQNVKVNRKATAAASWNPSTGKIEITLTGADTSGSQTTARFAVWSSENGQDDLKWYNGTKGGNGSWSCSVPLSAHKGTGDYYVHAYLNLGSRSSYAGGTGTRVEKTGATVSAATTNAYNGSFRVSITNVTIPSAVKQMRVAVWSRAKGQDDLIWTNAVRNGNSWYADINTASHLYDEGIYDIHVYVTDSGNNGYMCNGTTHTVKVGHEKTRITTSVDTKNAVLTVRLQDANLGRNVTSVKFPVWSKAHGQDDLVWHEAARNADGSWSVSINMGTHAYETGEYAVHAYQFTDTQQKILATYELTVNFDLPYVRRQARAILDQVGWNLKAAYDWVRSLPYYRATPNPEPGMIHSVFYGEFGFQNRKGNCYGKAAPFYWLAKELGYEVYFVEGYVASRGGGRSIHGWTEVIVDGKTYVCDLTFRGDGYMITYGAPGTWVYVDYERVK